MGYEITEDELASACADDIRRGGFAALGSVVEVWADDGYHGDLFAIESVVGQPVGEVDCGLRWASLPYFASINFDECFLHFEGVVETWFKQV